jgi:hypothetical protein
MFVYKFIKACNNFEKHFFRTRKKSHVTKFYEGPYTLHMDLYVKVQKNYSRVTKQLTRTILKYGNYAFHFTNIIMTLTFQLLNILHRFLKIGERTFSSPWTAKAKKVTKWTKKSCRWKTKVQNHEFNDWYGLK